MEFRATLPLRRMVRHYRAEPVQHEVVERIVETVRRAPSAGYSQGQRLLVLTTDTSRAEASRILGSAEREVDLEPWLESAPVHILVCTREDDYHERYRRPDKLANGEEIEWPVPYWFVDAGAALMLLLLGAVDEGLAAGVSGVPLAAASQLRSSFGIPDDVSVVALVTVGHPAPDPGWSAVTSRRTRSPAPTVRGRALGTLDLTDLEASQSLRLFLCHLNRIDPGTTWPIAAELDEALDGVALSFEDGFDRAVPVVAHPPGHSDRLCSASDGVAEEDSLDEAVDDDAPANHGKRRIPAGSTLTDTRAPG